MTKTEIANKVAAELQINQIQAKQIIQMVLDEIIETVASEGRLELRNFGVFDVRTRKPRRARNPRTGEEVMVPERKSVTFKPGNEMQRRLLSRTPLPDRKPD